MGLLRVIASRDNGAGIRRSQGARKHNEPCFRPDDCSLQRCLSDREAERIPTWDRVEGEFQRAAAQGRSDAVQASKVAGRLSHRAPCRTLPN